MGLLSRKVGTRCSTSLSSLPACPVHTMQISFLFTIDAFSPPSYHWTLLVVWDAFPSCRNMEKMKISQLLSVLSCELLRGSPGKCPNISGMRIERMSAVAGKAFAMGFPEASVKRDIVREYFSLLSVSLQMSWLWACH